MQAKERTLAAERPLLPSDKYGSQRGQVKGGDGAGSEEDGGRRPSVTSTKHNIVSISNSFAPKVSLT